MAAIRFQLFLFLAFLSSVFGSQCSLYGICRRYNGMLIPCKVDQPAEYVATNNLNSETTKKFEHLCPNYRSNQQLCCDHEQISNLVITLEGDIKKWFGSCPSCYTNIANLYCSITCDPNQGNFVRGIKLLPNDNFVDTVYVDALKEYVEKLYDSCKHVRHNVVKSLAMVDTICQDCFDIKFFKRIVQDYPLKNDQTRGIVLKEPSVDGVKSPLTLEVTSCDQIASNRNSACGCADCPASCSPPTEAPKVEEITETPTTESITRRRGKGAGSMIRMGVTPFLIILITSFLII